MAATINTMLTGASPTGDTPAYADGALADVTGFRNAQHFIAGGQGTLVQDSMGKPWNGDYVFSSGDLVEDLTHNFFLETGARNNKLKVYEMSAHPAAKALLGYLLVRGGVHQIAYARALENLTGADLMKLFPSPRIPTDKIPECRPHIERGDHRRIYRFSPDDYLEIAAVFNGPHPETGEDLEVVERGAPGLPRPRPAAPVGGLRTRLRPGGDRRDRGPAPSLGGPAGRPDGGRGEAAGRHQEAQARRPSEVAEGREVVDRLGSPAASSAGDPLALAAAGRSRPRVPARPRVWPLSPGVRPTSPAFTRRRRSRGRGA